MPRASRPTRCQGVIMRRMSVERRLLLKAAASAAFGLVNGATLADILQPDGSADVKNPGRDDLSVAQLRLGRI